MRQQSDEFLRLYNTALAQSKPSVWRRAGIWKSLSGNVDLVAQSANKRLHNANGNTVAAVKHFTANRHTNIPLRLADLGGGGLGADETNFEHDSCSGSEYC